MAAQTAPEGREYFTPLHHEIATQLGYKQDVGYASWSKVEKTAPVQVIDRLANFVAAHDQALIQRVREALEGLGNTPIKKLEPKPNEPLEVTYYQEAFKDCITEITAVLDGLEKQA